MHLTTWLPRTGKKLACELNALVQLVSIRLAFTVERVPMAAKMKWAREFDTKTRLGLEKAQSGTPYLCEHCPSEVRYNAGYEMVRKSVSIAVEHYFKLRQKHFHADDCLYNIEAQIKTAVRDADPDAVHQLGKGLYELRLMFPESYKTIRPSNESSDTFGDSSRSNSRGRRFVSSGKLNSYLNTAARILKVRNYCEDHQDIEEHLVLSFDGRKVRWSDFYIEQDGYAATYDSVSLGHVDYPLAVAGAIQGINERKSQDDAARSYWVVQLAVPKTAPDEQGVIVTVDVYVTTGKAALIADLQIGDEVIIFGEWQTRPPKVSPNTKPKSPNSPVKAWKNLPLRFSLTHAKQIVRVSDALTLS